MAKINGSGKYVAAALPLVVSLVSSALCPRNRASFSPAATPPSWVFPVVWYTLYALLGAAWYRAVASGGGACPLSLVLGATQALLATWTFVHSCQRKDRESTWVLLAIVLATGYAMLLSDDAGRLLLLPMLVWCSFATYLNAEKAAAGAPSGAPKGF